MILLRLQVIHIYIHVMAKSLNCQIFLYYIGTCSFQFQLIFRRHSIVPTRNT